MRELSYDKSEIILNPDIHLIYIKIQKKCFHPCFTLNQLLLKVLIIINN